MRKIALLILLLTIVTFAGVIEKAQAQVPITVWGYVYMPDGSPAAGASVKVSAAGVSKSTITDSSGKYKVDLTVSQTPVTVTVTASKGEYKGSASKSGEGVIRIDVHLKKPHPPPQEKKKTSLSLSADKSEYRLNETVILTGYISPAMKAEITITVTKPDGSQVKVKVQSKTDGSFSHQFAADTLGLWKAYAYFPGTKDYKSSKSPTVQFYVKVESKLNFNVLALDSKTAKIEGAIEPPVANATVMVYISIDGGKTWLHFCNTTTDENGRFILYVNTTISGNVLFKAVFPGSETHVKSELEKPVIFKVETDKEKEKLVARVKELEQRKEELESRITELEKENNQLKEKIEELSENLQKARENLETANKTITELEQKTREYKEKLQLYQITTLVGIPSSLAIGAALALLLKKHQKI